MSLLAWNCQVLGRLWTIRTLGSLIRGDFNEIFDNSEKCGGPLRLNWQMRNFCRALSDCDLHDIGFTGDPFTWSNRQLAPHTVLSINLLAQAEGPQSWSRPLRFKAAWLQSDQCEKVASNSWGMCLGNRRTVGIAAQLDFCQQNLKRWRHKRVYAFCRHSPDDIAQGTGCLRRVVDASMEGDLLKPYTGEKVSEALFQMAPLKSSVPNANRLKGFLDKIISPVQSAFVPGRLITDNILLAFELNHFLNSKSKGGPSWMALKLDVSKAYDKVEWPFLEQLAEQEGRLQGVSVCRATPPTSHLLFSDDTLIFCRTSLGSTQAILDVLEVYRLASGQEINFFKSLVAFSRNTRANLCSRIVTDLSIRRENKMELYLGLSSKVSRSKKTLLSTIRDIIWKHILGWNAKLLSQAGREVLIKSILQAIPTYTMSCSRLLLSLLREIQSMVANFWWNNGSQNKIHWVSWKRLCESKLVEGMGFR
ncbi:UNVERIFIED_CONTAM: hypothetical protein Sangu_1660000 [Sesamum angustifolium]|uniref:Reverse transcriptase domain-containing protein n=1 Tax=Sesamum angustifolium TaxID=2727405 RepID=A0AAW2MIF9_9LAMI